MKKTTRETIKKHVILFSLNSSNRKSAEEIVAITAMWLDSLNNTKEDVFVEACKKQRETSGYFPSIRDILARIQDVYNERARKIKKLPEPIPDLSPEQIKKNADRVRSVIRGIGMEVKKNKKDVKKND